ncbi:hypothetical protein dqs_2412 [Azoarcus olearius]|uniref:hypothetical protein n=1 Tax=Azoarcus sp. (strain BH72) TaxID=418699 RepID=UPI0008064343|nr:hypothetical protein [Azoarcus olearius]ANQ85443.1 hypothetical protein dqs_2412 [Azoarcus olearius]
MVTQQPPKYRSLLAVLDALAELIDDGRLAVSTGWEDNEQAVRLHQPGEPKLGAYIFIYGQPPGRYGVELDFPEIADVATANVPLYQEDLSLDQLLRVLRTHFNLPGYA